MLGLPSTSRGWAEETKKSGLPVAATSRMSVLHRLGEFVKLDGVLDEFAGHLRGQRLVIGKEIVEPREIGFRLLVVAAMNRVIGALEQALFAILDEFERRHLVHVGQIFHARARHQHGRGDVVFLLNLCAGMKILAQAERAPRAVGFKTHAQARRHERFVVALQFVAGNAVDDVHGEMTAPVVAPCGLVIALHDEDQFLDVLRDGLDPGVDSPELNSRVSGVSSLMTEPSERSAASTVRESFFAWSRKRSGIIAADQFLDAGRNPFSGWRRTPGR